MGSETGRGADNPVLAAARAFERDRYLSALRANGQVREDLLILAAFFAELQRIPAFVNEPMMGEIRYQWWQDAVMNGTTSGHPIGDALVDLLRRRRVLTTDLVGLFDAMRMRLDDQPFATDADLIQHLAATEGRLFRLAAVCFGAEDDDAVRSACDQAGVAYGLARVAVELPAVLAQGRSLAPRKLLTEAGVNELDSAPRLPSGQLAPEPWMDVRQRLVRSALTQARSAKSALQGTSSPVRSACRPLAMVTPYSRVIRRLRPGDGLAVTDVLPIARIWSIWRGV